MVRQQAAASEGYAHVSPLVLELLAPPPGARIIPSMWAAQGALGELLARGPADLRGRRGGI